MENRDRELRYVREVASHRRLLARVGFVVVLGMTSFAGGLEGAALSAGLAAAAPATWLITHSPDTGSKDILASVSCTSPRFCAAVGQHSDRVHGHPVSSTQVETWDGSTWTITPSPNPPSPEGGTRGALYGVSCTSPTSCMAVGMGFESTLAEQWDGSTWSIVATPYLGNIGVVLSVLDGISCVSSMNCIAVGYYYKGQQPGQPLVESWDGATWSFVVSPTFTGPNGSNELTSVSCTSPTACVAVGFQVGPGSYETLIETWDGSAWSITPSPNQGTQTNELYGVSCISLVSCVAVGTGSDTVTPNKTLIETWNGNAWSIATGPDGGYLSGVSCISATSCVAVGGMAKYPKSSERTLVETWDGTTWSATSSPSWHTTHLYGVSCPISIACAAVGNKGGPHGGKTFAEVGYPSVTLRPPSGRVGTQVRIADTGLNPQGTVDVYWDTTASTPLATGQADVSGSFIAAITVPPSANGTHLVLTEDMTSGTVVPTKFKVVAGG